MNHSFAQADPGGGGPSISINLPSVDWATLIPQIVGYFFDAIGTLLTTTLHTAFDGFWNSGANVLGQTDMAMTWGFGPVHDQLAAVQTAARAIIIFALIVVGLRGMLSSIMPRQPELVAEFINGVLASMIMVAAFPLLIPMLIEFTNQAATAVGRADLSTYLGSGVGGSPIVQLTLFVILLFFAIRLLIRAVWRIGFLAVLLPVGVAACALYALPQTRWMLGWWARVWGGMLLAQIPSAFALSIGAQLFAHGSGIGAFVYSIAFLQLATDLYTLIPFNSGAGSSGPPMGAMSWPAPFVFNTAGRAMGGVGVAASGLASAAGALRTASPTTYGYQ
jgi:hypothetical protein